LAYGKKRESGKMSTEMELLMKMLDDEQEKNRRLEVMLEIERKERKRAEASLREAPETSRLEVMLEIEREERKRAEARLSEAHETIGGMEFDIERLGGKWQA
jgi:N-acetylmuramic acid 6-phosphate (MurNAc-6-P) etherase